MDKIFMIFSMPYCRPIYPPATTVQMRISHRYKEICQSTDQIMEKPEKTRNGKMIQFCISFSRNIDMRLSFFKIQIEKMAIIAQITASLRTIWKKSQMTPKNADVLEKRRKPKTKNGSNLGRNIFLSIISSLNKPPSQATPPRPSAPGSVYPARWNSGKCNTSHPRYAGASCVRSCR